MRKIFPTKYLNVSLLVVLLIGIFAAFGGIQGCGKKSKKSAVSPVEKEVTKLTVPGVEWEKTYGGCDADWAFSIQQTKDGEYIVAGGTKSFGAGGLDFYIIRLDSNGNKLWEKTYGGSDDDKANSIQQTEDGGYIVAGWTKSFGAGRYDFYIIRLDEDGNKEWSKTYGGNDRDWAESIQQTSDGGYIVAGYTESFGVGLFDFYIIRLDSNGNEEWSKTYGGGSRDDAKSIRQTEDGGYVVAGGAWPFGAREGDFYVIRLDNQGHKVWEKTCGGSGWGAYSIQQAKDGGYIVAGTTFSFGAGGRDFYIIKLDESGNKIWSKTYGGSGGDYASSIQQTTDGGYIVAGETLSFGAGLYDFYILKLDASGNKVWDKTYGGSKDDWAYSIQQTSDGGYIVAGGTSSFGAGKSDFYIIKLSAE